MARTISSADLHDLIRTGAEVQTTVFEFGPTTISKSSKDDLSILTISGVYARPVAKEVERLALGWRGNLALEFKEIRVNPALGKKFDSSVLGLLKTLKERYLSRRRQFFLCTPPPELLDLLKLTGAIEGYTIVGESSDSLLTSGPPRATRSQEPSRRLPTGEQESVQKRIVNLNQSLKRTVSLEKGLDSAQKCVKRFLPQAPPQVEGYDFAFTYRSSEKVGGDFFDFIDLGDDNLGIVIGDVSGHGLDAAILMGISKKVISIRAKDGGLTSPKQVLARANADLVPDFNKYSFVTVLYGILEVRTGRFTFCRAGHEAPIVFSPRLGAHAVETKGVPLGTDLGRHLGKLLEETTVILPPGSSLFLCTDGLSECKNERGSIYSRERLVFSIGQLSLPRSCESVLAAILRTADDFSGGRPQEDDITAMLIHRSDTGG